MGTDDRDEKGSVEWIDLEPTAGLENLDARQSHLRWPYVAAAILVLLAAGGVVARNSHHASTSHAADTRVVTTASASGPSSIPALVASGTTSSGHPQLDVPASWQLFARADGAVVRVQLSQGRVTRTPIPQLTSSGPISFLTGPGEVLVRPLDAVPGYLVRDGGAATALPAALAGGGPVLAGPDPDHVWAPSGAEEMRLVALDGTPTDVTVTLPVGGGIAEADGSGYPMLITPSASYVARPGGPVRITGTTVLAVGETSWLTTNCDAEDGCTTSLVNKATGNTAVVTYNDNQWSPNAGLLSPDSSVAALIGENQYKIPTLHLANLRTGSTLDTDLSMGVNQGPGSTVLAWSPDGRWLFAVGQNGGLFAIDPGTGKFTDLAVGVQCSQLSLRTS